MGLTFQPKIEIKAKHLYVLTALALVAAGGVYLSTAYGTGQPQQQGHTLNEITGDFSCPKGQAIQKIWKNNGSAVCSSAGGGSKWTKGMWCGWKRRDKNKVIECKGHNPYKSCPAGFESHLIPVEYFGNKKYVATCVKNLS